MIGTDTLAAFTDLCKFWLFLNISGAVCFTLAGILENTSLWIQQEAR